MTIHSGAVFSVESRERVRDRLVEKATRDSRLVAAAAIGGSAEEGDRWSDIDLTFGVADGIAVEEVLGDWTQDLATEFDTAVLFDLRVASTIYRVFLFPGSLQVDLSFAPSKEFGARGPRFRLLFGEAAELPWPEPQPAAQRFGLAVHHALRAHLCIERGRLWQAEFWVHEARDEVLSLACRRLGLAESYGRGFDRLSAAVREPLTGALVRELSDVELRRALQVITESLLREASDIPNADPRANPRLEELRRLVSESWWEG
jgi:hypothetical protein